VDALWPRGSGRRDLVARLQRETSTTPPPTVTNTSFLLSPYGNWDDHDPRNVIPLVDDLAARLDTNGAQSGEAHLGTDINAVVPALETI